MIFKDACDMKRPPPKYLADAGDRSTQRYGKSAQRSNMLQNENGLDGSGRKRNTRVMPSTFARVTVEFQEAYKRNMKKLIA